MRNNLIKDWVISIIIAIILAILINKFLIFKVEVPTGSMKPTINEGDMFLATRIYNLDNLKRGDILVFYNKEENENMIKRLIGLPKDEISIQGKKLYVNGKLINEEYLKYNDDYFGEFKVPENKYFFLGDNRETSLDARYWKNPYIDAKDIKGKAQLRIYPFNNFGSIK